MLPNQRRTMLRSSPVLIVYAWFLLLSAYIYSMDLTEAELPTKIGDIKLSQIGFQKVTVLPYQDLLVKAVYTTMFWITLRQYMQERREARQSSALADMVAPLQVTVGTAAGKSPKTIFCYIKRIKNIANYFVIILMIANKIETRCRQNKPNRAHSFIDESRFYGKKNKQFPRRNQLFVPKQLIIPLQIDSIVLINSISPLCE